MEMRGSKKQHARLRSFGETRNTLFTCHLFNYYTLNPLSLFWFVESVQWIFEISTCDVITAEYTIIMSRTLKVTGNHIVHDRSAWFLRVIMYLPRPWLFWISQKPHPIIKVRVVFVWNYLKWYGFDHFDVDSCYCSRDCGQRFFCLEMHTNEAKGYRIDLVASFSCKTAGNYDNSHRKLLSAVTYFHTNLSDFSQFI